MRATEFQSQRDQGHECLEEIQHLCVDLHLYAASLCVSSRFMMMPKKKVGAWTGAVGRVSFDRESLWVSVPMWRTDVHEHSASTSENSERKLFVFESYGKCTTDIVSNDMSLLSVVHMCIWFSETASFVQFLGRVCVDGMVCIVDAFKLDRSPLLHSD